MVATRAPRPFPVRNDPVRAAPHPSRGGSRGYAREIRNATRLMNIPYVKGITPCPRTQRRYRQQFIMEGHDLPYKPRGNKFATGLVGTDKLLLLLFRIAFPKERAVEVAAFIFRNTIRLNRRVYSASQISKAEDSLGLTRKRASTLALQALTPENAFRRNIFHTQGYPYGRIGTPIESFIDVDECGIMLEECNRAYGKGYFGTRVTESGNYGRGVKYTITLAIASTGERWCRVERKTGTDINDFVSFIEQIVDNIDQEAYAGVRTIMMDNLSSHCSPLVHQTVLASGQRILFRPKYYPSDAPIEYVFNTIQSELRMSMRQVTPDNFVQQIQDIIANLNGFRNYFEALEYGA